MLDYKDLIKNLENIFTPDGRGRPKKAKLLLELINSYGLDEILKQIKIISERDYY